MMTKCWGELIYITTYLIVFFIFTIGLIYSFNYGKPLTILVEFSIAMLIDQLKNLPNQFITYWVINRRCGTMPNVRFKEWKDERIFEGGIENSLLDSMRKETI